MAKVKMLATPAEFRQIGIDLKIKTGRTYNSHKGYIHIKDFASFLYCFSYDIRLAPMIYFEMKSIHFQYGPNWGQSAITCEFVGGSKPGYFKGIFEHKYTIKLPLSVYQVWLGLSRMGRLVNSRPKVFLSDMECSELFFASGKKMWGIAESFKDKLYYKEHSQFQFDLRRLKAGYPTPKNGRVITG